VLVPIRWWHFCHLAARIREAGEVFWPSKWPAQEYAIHRGYRDRRPPNFSRHWHIQEAWWLSGPSDLPKTYPHKTLPEPWITSNIQSVLSTLVHRARALYDNLHDELEFLKTTFWENGYSIRQIGRAVILAVRTYKSQEKATLIALLPHARMTYGRPSRMLAKHNINPLNPELNPICYLLALLGAHHFLHVSRIRVKILTFRRLMSIYDISRLRVKWVGLPPRKISSLFHPVKDDLGLRTLGVYDIPCECGQVYREFRKLLCSYKRCWKWCPRAYIRVWTRLILFANTFCRSACEMFLMYRSYCSF